MAYQPYYVAYCKAHGKTPEEMLAHDGQTWRGGCMVGFILWMRGRWNDWRVSVGRRNLECLTSEEKKDFGKFLEST